MSVPISVEVVAATRPYGAPHAGLITLEIVLPGWVQRELLTHKRFARNFTSARAMSTDRTANLGYYLPPVFYTQGRGMMASRIPIEDQAEARNTWIKAWDAAEEAARRLTALGACKEQANRPFNDAKMMRGIVTATSSAWAAFLALRNEEHADTAMVVFADLVDRRIASAPWVESFLHAPYIDWSNASPLNIYAALDEAAARLARTSYERPKHGKDDAGLAAMLKADGHLSPFEHIAIWSLNPYTSAVCSVAADRTEAYGWSNYRSILENDSDVGGGVAFLVKRNV